MNCFLAYVYALFDNGIHQLQLNDEGYFDKIKELSDLNKNDFTPENHTLITLTNHGYLLDYDPVESGLYFAECITPIRQIFMSCSKTRGIFRVNLNQSIRRKEVNIKVELRILSFVTCLNGSE